MACNYNYKGKVFTEEEVKPVVSYHYFIEDKLLEYGMDNIEKVNNIVQSVDGKNTVAHEVVQKINNDFGLEVEVAIMDSDTGIINIDVSPIADSLINRKDSPIVEEFDAEIDDTKTVNRKVYNIDEDVDTLEEYNNKVSLMERRFADVGVASHIVMDGDITSSGQLLGTSDQRYKDMVDSGEINQGDAVIVVNPRNLFKDTVFHEYGHLFIDLAGGMNNPRIRYAYAKIKDNVLSREVQDQYPELVGDELAKEIMATAIGKEATDIFEGSETDRNFIQKFLDWIKDTVKGILGIPTDSIKTLANELLGNTENSFRLTGKVGSTTQLFKGLKEERAARKKNEKLINGAQLSLEQTSRRINAVLAETSKSTEKNTADFNARMKALKGDLDKLSKNSNLLAIDSFITKASEMAENIQEHLQELRDKANDEKITIDYSMLHKVDLYLSLFDIIEDVRKNIRSGYFKQEFKTEGWNEETTKDFTNRVDALKAANNEIQELRLEVGKHHIANRLVKYSNRSIVERRLELEREYKDKYKIGDTESMSQYNVRIRNMINSTIVDEMEDLKEDERRRIYDRLTSSPADIGSFAMWVSSEKDLNSMVIQLASKLLDEADLQRDQMMIEKRLRAFEVFKDFDKETSGLSGKEKYKGLYQEGSDGNLYITGEYNVEWYIQRNKLNQDYFKAVEDHGEGSVEARAALSKMNKFDRENSTYDKTKQNKIFTPSSKWKNKDYVNIMSKPESGKARMLQFLIDNSIDNNKMLHGNRSLIHNSYNSETLFIQAPSVGRNLFEKATSGDIGTTIKDSFERIYKAKTDDTEFGEINDTDLSTEKDALKVLANSKGDLRYGVPIHFRNNMSLKEVSYDLLSSMMMDSYMAMNYSTKSGLQVELELMRDITANKEVDQTQGFKKRMLLNALTGDKVAPKTHSNEYKTLKSIIENRLYGIKTVNTEYAKLASSLMSWTANSMLVFNLPSGVANMLQGKLFNFMESVAGEYFDTGDMKAAEILFWKDMKGWVDDIGRPVQTAKTNQLMNVFNIQNEFKPLTSKFIENNRGKALFKNNTGYMFNHMGEFYMHATLMYSILNRVKAQNGKGQFINKDGQVVTNERKAMTLAQALDVDEKGNITLNKHVVKSSFGNSSFSLNTKKDKGLLEVKNLVNKIAHDLHGNYNEEIQAAGQRYVMGKMLTMFRKWIVPGFNRRWRGAVNFRKPTDQLQNEVDNFYSEDLQSFQEGYYTTTLRFLTEVKRNFKQLGFNAIGNNWNKLSDREKANMRRFGIELGTIVFTLAASSLMYGLAEGIDDPLARESMFYMTYFTRRIFSELAFYSNPAEAFKIMRDPTATLSYVGKMGIFVDQLLDDVGGVATGEGLELYERGRYKGEFKLWKRTGDLLPGVNQYYRDIEESTSWMFNIY